MKSEPLTLAIFKNAVQAHGSDTCKMSVFLKKHPEHIVGTFEAIADPTVTVSAIHRVLKGKGYTGGRESVNSTRQGCIHCSKLKPQRKVGR